MDEKQIAVRQLEHGAKFPYDGDGPAIDWAHAAARGVLADLCDRRGVKHELREVDDDVRVELVASVAAIIRAAAPPAPSAEPQGKAVQQWRLRGAILWSDDHPVSNSGPLEYETRVLWTAPITSPDHTALLRQALGALGHFDDVDKTDAAIDALRAALELKPC
jgi:hypothetical protein